MKVLRRLLGFFQRRRLEAEMKAEMKHHLEMQAERYRSSGIGADEASYAALRRFGNVASVQERAREARGWGWWERTLKDIQVASRGLLKSPGFTLVAVATLALGIGLTTAAFSLLNTIWLRPLPFEDAESLVHLRRSTPQHSDGAFAPADYLELKRNESSFGVFAGYAGEEVSMADPGRPAEATEARRVSADFFRVLGVAPELGRAFLPEEEVYGRHRVVVLSHALWQNRFGGSALSIGRTVRLDGEEYEIVGVLPAWASDDRFIRQTGLFRPLAFTPTERAARRSHWVGVIGRRSDTLAEAQGNEFVAAFGRRVAVDLTADNEGVSWRCEGLLASTESAAGKSISSLLLGLSGCVLLIACANLANLLLARTISRSHELAVRAALGASRLQLVRPLGLEALVLALTGGGAGVLVSLGASHWLSEQSIAGGSGPLAHPLDWRVLGFALGTSVLTAFFFGVAPALVALRFNVNDTLKRGGRGTAAGGGPNRLRQALIVGQFATAMVLVTAAGLLACGAVNFLRGRTGWDSRLLAQGGIDLPRSRYAAPESIWAFDRQLLALLQQTPGVQAASLSYGLPSDGPIGPRPYVIAGRDVPTKGQELAATYNGVTNDYFVVTGIPVLRGRVFRDSDSATSPRVAIVNESLARALFPDGNEIGQRIARADMENSEWAEIVGVVADVRAVAVYQRPVSFQIYHPFAQEPWHQARFAVRTSGVAPASVLPPLRAALTGFAPDLPVRDLTTVDGMIEHSAFELFLLRNMLGTFALLGLGLAALGIVGVIARHVAQRRSEIGIRMALGANATDIVQMIVGAGIRLALTGAGLGLLGAFGLSRLIASIMPAMRIDTELVLSASTFVLVVIALAASWLPARRAAKVDPVIALRAE